MRDKVYIRATDGYLLFKITGSNSIFKTYLRSFRDLEGALSAYELLGAITAFTLNFLLSRI